MPKGVYPHVSQKQRESALKNFAKGHLPEVREKALNSIRENAKTEEFRNKMSKIMLSTWKDPVRRKKMSEQAKDRVRIFGSTFKGGNGQEPLDIVKALDKILCKQGFIAEYPISLKEYKGTHKVTSNYKVDFGNPAKKMAIELDGVSHNPLRARLKDKKKDEVLQSLGWTVLRIKH